MRLVRKPRRKLLQAGGCAAPQVHLGCDEQHLLAVGQDQSPLVEDVTVPPATKLAQERDPLRDELVIGLNGNYVQPDMAWAIIHRWDALVEIAKAVSVIADYENENGPYVFVRVDEIREVAAALARLDGAA